MDMNFLKTRLLEMGFKKVSLNNSLSGIEFDLVAEISDLFLNFTLLVKVVPLLDTKTALTWESTHIIISERFKKPSWKGNQYIICIVAEEITGEALFLIKKGQIEVKTNNWGMALYDGESGVFYSIAGSGLNLNKKYIYLISEAYQRG